MTSHVQLDLVVRKGSDILLDPVLGAAGGGLRTLGSNRLRSEAVTTVTDSELKFT